MTKNKIKVISKQLVIALIISLIIELGIMLYNVVINKIYTKFNFIGNNSIEISKQDLNIEIENNETNIKVKNISNTKIYNIALILNKENKDVYMRVIMNNDAKFMPKENAKATKFKVYYLKGIETNEFSINYGEGTIEPDSIEKIVINDNLDYMPKIEFSVIQFLIIFIILEIIFIISLLYKMSETKNIKIKKEILFLYMALFIGIIFVFINVPQIRYDEHAHFWRAYEIARGNIISRTTNELPNSVIELFKRNDGTYPNKEFNYETLKEKISEPLNEENKIAFPVGATGSLTPISYIPQVIGILIGRVLNFSPMVILWLARMANLLCYIALVFLAIKIMPFEKWKWIIMIIALFPMTMNLAATVSPDTIIISTTLLAISYVFYLKDVVKKITMKNMILLGILFMIPIVCKIVYFPLCLLVFILPKDKFENKLKRNLYYILTALIIFVTYFALNKLVAKGDYAIAIRTNMTEQILFTISDLSRDFVTAINTFYSESSLYFFELIGGWNTINIISVVFFIILLFVMFNKESTQYEFNRKEKNIVLAIIIIQALGVIAAMYLGWTQARQTTVEGIQGRYFLPILPLLCMLICRNKFDCKIKNKEMKFIIALIVIYIIIFGFSIKSYIG